jgi:acyl carrier protein
MDAIEGQVRTIITSLTGLPSHFSEDANLYLDLGVASVHALQLLTELEKSFRISIPDDDFVEATSLRQLTTMIHGLQEKAGDSAHA